MATREKEYLYGQAERLGVTIVPSEANFVLLKTPMEADLLAERLLERGFAVKSAASFGLRDCARVTVGAPEVNRALVAALEEILAP